MLPILEAKAADLKIEARATGLLYRVEPMSEIGTFCQAGRFWLSLAPDFGRRVVMVAVGLPPSMRCGERASVMRKSDRARRLWR